VTRDIRLVRHTIESSLAVHASPAIGHSASGTWDPWSRALLVVMGRGLHPPGWAISCQLAVVLTMAAAPGWLAAARGVRPAHRRRWSPRRRRRRERPRTGLCTAPACSARPRVPPIRTLSTTASAPAMVRNWYQDGLDTRS